MLIRRLARAAIAVGISLAAILAGGPPAQADLASPDAAPGSIRVQMTSEDASYEEVTACPIDGVECRHAVVDDDNAVVFDEVDAGDYVLWVASEWGHEHVEGWWPRADRREDAGIVSVAAGARTEIVWQLRQGAAIRGTVTKAPAPGTSIMATVTLTDASGRAIRTTDTATHGGFGQYVLPGISAGTYTLTAIAKGFVPVSEQVVVSQLEDIRRDLEMTARGSLVIQSEGYRSSYVSVFDLDGRLVARESFLPPTREPWYPFSRIDFDELDAGQYRVLFEGGAEYPTWNGVAATSAESELLTIRSGESTLVEPRFIQRHTLPREVLTTTVTGPDKELVDGARVTLFDADGNERASATSSRGRMTVGQVPPGWYRIRFDDALAAQRFPYATRWYGGTDLASATPVFLSGAPSLHLSVSLPRIVPVEGATVSGRVRIAGAPAEGARITAFARSADGEVARAGTGYVRSDGSFAIRGLRPGKYVFQFQDSPRWENFAVPRFLPNASTAQSATVYSLTAGQVRSLDVNVDTGFYISYASAIRGRVTDGAGQPLAGITIVVTNAPEWSDETHTAVTDADGLYEINADNGYPSTTVTVKATSKTAGARAVVDLSAEVIRIDFRVARIPTATAPVLPSVVRVGATAKATISGWTSGMTYSFQWKRNAKAIVGATKSTYLPVAADRGQSLTLTVTGKRDGYVSTTRTSTARVVAYGVLTPPAPVVQGVREVGEVLNAKRGTVVYGATYTYQWLNNGRIIAGATRSFYRLSTTDLGDRISVKVTARKPGYWTVSTTSPAVGPIGR